MTRSTSPSGIRIRARFRALGAALLAAALLSACAGGNSQNGQPTAAQSGAQSGEASLGRADEGSDQVSIVLDWTPNTNHTGIFVAQERGYYEQAGLEVDILPYSQAGVENVVLSGGADFGISGASSVTQANARGEDLIMVLNLQQKSSAGVAVRADSTDITRPRDLDGKLFASWGAAETLDAVRQMVIDDGGTGDFETVTLGTSAYEAVWSGKADFAQGLSTWEGIEAELEGSPLRFFMPGDHGVTVTPAEIGISARRSFLSENQDVARRFVQATQRGYEDALADPDATAQLLVDANPQAKLDPELARSSQELLSSQYWQDATGGIGHPDTQAWSDYVTYLASHDLLIDADGNPSDQVPEVSDLVTDTYLR